ncbi:MAG: hypothetical protein FIA92_04840 [Chloroflexi bacterium]|nr:hypothetical protein [Chloroflexota bacterium]
MIEYGGGIREGPAGQVGGGGGGVGTAPDFGGGDPFANIRHTVDGAAAWVGSLSTVELALLVGAIFVGLIILRRAF